VTSAAEDANVAYCVFDVRDLSARMLAAEGARVLAGPPEEGALLALTEGGIRLYSAADWEDMEPDAGCCAIVREIDSYELACEVKLKLSAVYPDDANAVVLRGSEISRIKLFELDRLEKYDHMSSVLVMPEKDIARKNACSASDLMRLVRMSKFYTADDFEALVSQISHVFGAAAYAEDRGEFFVSDVLTAACTDLLEGNG